MSGDEIDFVILTGGHSRWYFVEKMLLDQIDGFEKLNLSKIINDPGRIFKSVLPQETVADGLTYKLLPNIAITNGASEKKKDWTEDEIKKTPLDSQIDEQSLIYEKIKSFTQEFVFDGIKPERNQIISDYHKMIDNNLISDKIEDADIYLAYYEESSKQGFVVSKNGFINISTTTRTTYIKWSNLIYEDNLLIENGCFITVKGVTQCVKFDSRNNFLDYFLNLYKKHKKNEIVIYFLLL